MKNKIIAIQPESSRGFIKGFKDRFYGYLLLIIVSAFMICCSLLPGTDPKIIPTGIFFLIFFATLFIGIIKIVMFTKQQVYIKVNIHHLNDSISIPSFPAFFHNKKRIFIKFNQIRYFQYIRNKNGVYTGIQITTNDNRTIIYKKKFLKENISKIDYYLKHYKVKLKS